MSAAAAQLLFVAEFVTMLVAAAGMILVGFRPSVTSGQAARLATLAGFLATGAAAFAHGSRLYRTDPSVGLSTARLAGGLLLLAGSLWWVAGGRSRWALRTGVAVGLVAAVVEAAGGPATVTDVASILGSALIGVALALASRRSIAARVGAGAAGTLLLVVVVLSLALSAVISSAVQQDLLVRLASQARTSAAQILDSSNQAIKDARFTAGDLVGYFRAENPDPLVQLGASGNAASAVAVGQRLQQIAELYPVGGFAYGDAAGDVVASSGGLRPAVAAAALHLPVFAQLSCDAGGLSAVVVADGAMWAAGVAPECVSGASQRLGLVLAVSPVDSAFLARQRTIDPTLSLAIVGATQVLASSAPSGQLPPTETLLHQRSATPSTRAVGSRFFAVQPIAAAGTGASPALVLSTANTSLVATRDRLFKTLFLIALGGTLLALGLSAYTGDRITAGVRRLTDVALRIQSGQPLVTAGVSSPDEVGVLGSAFDSMVGSLHSQAGALRSAAEEEARLRNRLEAVVAGMSEALVAVDRHGRITDFNRAAEELTSKLAGEVRGLPLATVIDLRRSADGVMVSDGAPLFAGGVPLLERAEVIPAWLAGAGGAEIPVAVSAGPLVDPAGERTGSVLVLRDLRREHEVERMKTEFLSRVGHELRTPLTSILGYADILVRRRVGAPQAQQWHEEIRLGARRLTRIVEMLEFLSSEGAGRTGLTSEVVAPAAVVENAAERWKTRLGGDHRLVCRVGRQLPEVRLDGRWMGTVIDELVDNAVKFSPAGGPIGLAVTVAPGDASTETGVEITISDRGAGMTTAQAAAVFGEFVQADGSDTRRYGGLGLGLALVQRVVDGHGGRVTYRPNRGGGSRFAVWLPAATSPAGPSTVRLADLD